MKHFVVQVGQHAVMAMAWIWNHVTANPTVVISICALGLTIYQATLTRRHQRLSCQPHLNHGKFFKGKEMLFVIANNGLGPARIRNFELRVDGDLIEGSGSIILHKAFERLFPGRLISGDFNHLGPEYSLPAGKEMRLADLKFQEPYPTKDEFEDGMKRLLLTIRYESFYGESWWMTTQPKN